MATNFRTTLRTARAQAFITDCGAGAKMKFWNGTRPAAVTSTAVGNTLLATVTFGATIGTAISGAVDFDEAGSTQASASHVAGTPTFVDLETSAGALVSRTDIGAGATSWPFTGTVTVGQNVTLTALLFTEGNA